MAKAKNDFLSDKFTPARLPDVDVYKRQRKDYNITCQFLILGHRHGVYVKFVFAGGQTVEYDRTGLDFFLAVQTFHDIPEFGIQLFRSLTADHILTNIEGFAEQNINIHDDAGLIQ